MTPPVPPEELRQLIDRSDRVCVSIYLPTRRSGREVQQNPIRFRNLLRRAEQETLERRLARPRELQRLFAPAHELLEEAPFWQHQLDGLAVFLCSGLFRSYRVPIRFRELAEVATRFHLKPLLRLLGDDGEFHVLSLNRHEVRLFRSTRFAIRELDTSGIPKSTGELTGEAVPTRQLQWRTTGPTSRGERHAPFHGHGRGDADPGPELRRFLAAVDRGLRERVRPTDLPLVLAGPEDLLSIYREVAEYPRVVAGELRANTTDLDAEELRERAWPLVEPLFVEERVRAADRYRRLAGTGRASCRLGEIVPASHDGRVDSLLVARGRYRRGSYDRGAREVRLDDGAGDGGQDLLDLAAVQTLRHQGKVFVVEPELLPRGAESIAAVFRY